MNDRNLFIVLMFCYYAALGILFPYLPLNLSKMLSTKEIGILMAVGPFIMVVFQPFWGWLSDRWSIRNVLLCALTGSIASSLGFLYAESFVEWMVLIGIYFFFLNPLSTLIDTMALLKYHEQFGRIRLWGSIGFGCAVFLGGFFVGFWIIWIHLFFLALTFAILWFIKNPIRHKEAPNDTKAAVKGIKGAAILFRNPSFLLLLFFLFFTAAAMKGNYTFYSIGLKELLAPGWLLGTAWLLQVIPEIWVFLWADRLAKKLTPIKIAAIGAAAYLLQFLILGWIPNLWVWTAFQPLVSLAYCFWYFGAIQSVKQMVSEPYQATGQSIFSATCYGIGGVLGSSFSGLMVDQWHVFGFYKVAAVLCGISAMGLWAISKMVQTHSESAKLEQVNS